MRSLARARVGLNVVAGLVLFVSAAVVGQEKPAESPGGPATTGVGLIRNDPGAFQGYTLLSPLQSKSTFLIDMQGRVVRSWETDATPSSIAYLLENGNLLRPSQLANPPFGGRTAGAGGKVQEISWNGELVWDFTYATSTVIPHHDLTRLPNGNVLMIVEEKKTAEEAIAAGRIATSVEGGELHADALVEIKPTGKSTGDVVWSWRLWDHLIQDHDRTKANFGDVAARPERVDLNFTVKPGGRGGADWTHFNAVAYNAELDQVVVSLRNFSEIWIIDHSTSTQEAAGSTGGRAGKGGDLLYRWGNPQAYRAGTVADRRLFGQHNAHWIPKGLQGAGHLLIYNNGDGRPQGAYSTVDEIAPPVDARGRYTQTPGGQYGPESATWSYSAPNPTDFYSFNISGAMRLPNGNTLVCAGAPGIVFEITPDKKVVWQYNLPQWGTGRNGRNVFRALRFAPDYPGLRGRQLTPGKPLAEMGG
jgi:arylsulfotransferase ASST